MGLTRFLLASAHCEQTLPRSNNRRTDLLALLVVEAFAITLLVELNILVLRLPRVSIENKKVGASQAYHGTCI